MNPEELIKNLLINNTYNVEAQCGTHYDALNVSMEEMAKLIVKSLSDHSLMSSIISESGANGVCDTRKHNWDYIKGKIHCDKCGHPLHIADER